MPPELRTPSANALPIPRVEALLSRLRSRLTRQILLHGLGTVLLIVAAWLVFAFFADWLLHVPAPVRWFHLAVLLAAPAYFLWRELLRHLGRRPDDSGLAVLIERARPEHKELFVSAVELRAEPHDSTAFPLVKRVVEDAESRADAVGLEGVLEERAPRKRFAVGAVASVACAAVFVANAEEASIFFARLVGRDVSWPQATHLAVEIPLADDRAQVEVQGDRILVRIARGSDIPILVRAEGEVPETVTMHFDGGHVTQLPAAGGSVFRTLLRSCQEDLAFHVTGGDDRDELPRVEVTVLQPPDVAGVCVHIEPPEYASLEPYTEFDQDVEVLAGSRLRVSMLPDPAGARGIARLLPEDREIELREGTWPALDDEAGETPRTALEFDLIPDGTLRYRFELKDETGLPNPDPGLFAIHVIEDRLPEVDVLAPGRSDIETIVGGALPLRVRVSDDYGLSELSWLAESAGLGENELVRADLEWTELESTGEARARTRVLAARLMNVADLTDAETVTEGQQFTLEVLARDNCRPEANEGKSVPIRVRIVSTDELLRRLQDRLARARLRANELVTLQREKYQRVQELLGALESDEVDAGLDTGGIGAALTGQRRVHGDASALMREMASITETLLYSRLDERAGGLLDFLDAELSRHADKAFHNESWLALVQRNANDARAPGLAGKLVEILGIALEASETHARGAIDALAAAGDAPGLEAVHDALTQAGQEQERTIERVELLLERLAEWDNFQSVLALTKDILNRQKNLLERTKQYEKDQ